MSIRVAPSLRREAVSLRRIDFRFDTSISASARSSDMTSKDGSTTFFPVMDEY